MASPLFLGLDFGTSGARACVIAGNGEIEEFARIDFAGLGEHEFAPAWRTALFDLLAGLPRGLRLKLRAIALDATSATVLACDGALQPTATPLLYNDSRARAEAAEIAHRAGAGHPAASATSGLAKVIWLRRRLDGTPTRMFLNQADWLTALLSGRPGRSDFHNALKMGFDVEAGGWPAWVGALAGTDPLPEVVPPGSTLGVLARERAHSLGIATDCLVRAGTTDSIAAFLATGAGRPGDAVSSLGTTLVLKLVSVKRIDDARTGVYSHWFGRNWLAGGASNTGGGVLRQFFDGTRLKALSAEIDPDTNSGLDYYPLPRPGERFPINDPDLPPRLLPRPSDDKAFLHGLLEGLAAVEAMGYRKLVELGAERPVQVLSTGGSAANSAYQRIRARRLGLPVAAARQQEAAYGAALLARDGVSLFPGVRDV
jgi:sugar (pentulose or hexulose) kinase